MNINIDFTKPVVIRSNIEPWVNSPLPGVTRRILEREGGEFETRATSIVNYEPNSSFSEHCHTRGEEYFQMKLETFQKAPMYATRRVHVMHRLVNEAAEYL